MLSDSRACLDVIESVWRSGDANQAVARDRGAMVGLGVTPAPHSSGLTEWILSEECVPRLDCVSPEQGG